MVQSAPCALQCWELGWVLLLLQGRQGPGACNVCGGSQSPACCMVLGLHDLSLAWNFCWPLNTCTLDCLAPQPTDTKHMLTSAGLHHINCPLCAFLTLCARYPRLSSQHTSTHTGTCTASAPAGTTSSCTLCDPVAWLVSCRQLAVMACLLCHSHACSRGYPMQCNSC